MAFKASEAEALVIRTARLCAICNNRHRVQVHHIVALDAGGSDDISNGIPLCPNCHDEVHATYVPGRVTRQYTDSELRGHLQRTIDMVASWEHRVMESNALSSIEAYLGRTNEGSYDPAKWPPELLALIARLATHPRSHPGSASLESPSNPSTSGGLSFQVYLGRRISVVLDPSMKRDEVRFQLEFALVNRGDYPAALTWLETRLGGHPIPIKQFVDVSPTERVPSRLRLPQPVQPKTTETYCVEFESIGPGMSLGEGYMQLSVEATINGQPYRSEEFTVFGGIALAQSLANIQRNLQAGAVCIDLPLLPKSLEEFRAWVETEDDDGPGYGEGDPDLMDPEELEHYHYLQDLATRDD